MVLLGVVEEKDFTVLLVLFIGVKKGIIIIILSPVFPHKLQRNTVKKQHIENNKKGLSAATT